MTMMLVDVFGPLSLTLYIYTITGLRQMDEHNIGDCRVKLQLIALSFIVITKSMKA